MFSDTQELANFGLLKAGINPDKSVSDDWDKAAKELKKQKPLVRKYYDQDYIDALGNGEIWITQAWSGDIFQKNLSDGTNFKFVIPDEGGTIWTDNLTIPITAKSPLDALSLIDFFYRTDIAAELAEYINYVCPVPAAQAQMRKDAARKTGDDKTSLLDVANSKLVFPPAAVYSKLHYYVTFDSVDDQDSFQKTFEPIVLG
jgi:spermidine/putrescine transport system substrate-binding protein